MAKRVKCSHSVVLAFSALKWLHSFIPVTNPLDNDLCRNIVEAAKRDKNQSPKRAQLPMWKCDIAKDMHVHEDIKR